MNKKDKSDNGKCIDFKSRSEEGRKAKKNKEEFEKYLSETQYELDTYSDEEYDKIKDLFDDFLTGVEKSFERDCKRKMSWSIEKIISFLKKDEIIAKLITLSIGYSKKDKKAELVEHYLENYERVYRELFEYITEDVYKDLMKLKIQEYNIDLDLVEELKYPGLIDILGIGTIGTNKDGELRYFIPKEIAEIIDNFPFEKKSMKRNKEIVEVTKGLLKVYGVIHKEKLLEFLIEYKIVSKKDDVEKINSIIKMNIAAEESLLFTEGYYLDSSIAFIQDLREVMNTEGEYKRFTKKEILEVKTIKEEIRGANFISIRNFLRQFNIDEEELEEEILEMYDIYQLSTDGEREIINHIIMNYDMPDSMIEEYSREILNVFNSMPYWKLKGFSKNEIENKNYKTINEIKKKRTEMCICGSGKEFRDCCGKNVIEVDFTKIK
ncbi:MAG: SEC-C metal-binding domain-containing protein [Clostridium sp.]|uniref:SEC-C domain-containing protein n=1 Tax=Clostridium sp. TaxID=1506 RepID=UPI003EE4DF9F